MSSQEGLASLNHPLAWTKCSAHMAPRARLQQRSRSRASSVTGEQAELREACCANRTRATCGRAHRPEPEPPAEHFEQARDGVCDDSGGYTATGDRRRQEATVP